MMTLKSVTFSFFTLISLAFYSAIGFANPLKASEFNKALLSELPNLQNSKIAFIDLSAKKLGPKITITNLDGDLLESFLIPSDRYSPEWTNWGPGISFDVKSQTIWFLSPQVGLTEFNLKGELLKTVNFPKASHQIQITPEGSLIMPYSWDTEEDFQLSEVGINGKTIFQWRGKDFVNKFAHSNSIASSQPPSFTATTSAVKTVNGNFYLSMAQKDLILKINKTGEVIWQKDVSTRPHTLVIQGDNLIGYSARSPNRLMLMNDRCNCFKEVLMYEAIGGNVKSRTLSLQHLGKKFWFSSGVIGLYILDDEGKIYWKLTHDGLKGRPIGFHAAVLLESK
jgi:hypothetical protein